MARCTLDDLVPSLKCNKITLEPITNLSYNNNVNFAQYSIHIDASIYDYIELHDGSPGLANYLLTDTFRENVEYACILSRTMAVKNFHDFLRSRELATQTEMGNPFAQGLKKSQSAFIFREVIKIVSEIYYDANFTNFLNAEKTKIMSGLAATTDSGLYNSNWIATAVTGVPYTYVLKIENLISAANYLFDTLPTNSAINGSTINQTFKGKVMRHIFHTFYSKPEFFTFSGEDAIPLEILQHNQTQLIQGGQLMGERTQDEDGNLYYDFKVKVLKDNPFLNDVVVTDCYFHAVSRLDIEKVLDNKPDVTLDATVLAMLTTFDAIDFWYNDIDECAILRNSLPASPIVQDFRISERVQELIRSDRTDIYDEAIDSISLIAPDIAVNEDGLPLRENGITSHLYSSYVQDREMVSGPAHHHEAIGTRNYFFFDILKYLKRKSSLSFLYNNIAAPRGSGTVLDYGETNPGMSREDLFGDVQTISLFDNVIKPFLKIEKMDIYRVRVDSEDPNERRVLVNSEKNSPASDIKARGVPIGVFMQHNSTQFQHLANTAQLYEFYDSTFSNLSDGEYVYEIEIDVKDPMIDAVKFYSRLLILMINKLKLCVEYIHNNAGEYNELRDELSDSAKEYIHNQIHTPDFENGHIGFEILHNIFTGLSLREVQVIDVFTEFSFDTDLYSQFTDELAATGKFDFSLFPVDAREYESALTQKSNLNRRVIENYLRIAEDLLFGVSKFVEISMLNAPHTSNPTPTMSGTSSTNSTARERLQYKRRWKFTKVKASLDPRMMLSLFPNQARSRTPTGVQLELKRETMKHTSDASPLPNHLLVQQNSLTPARLGDTVLRFNSFSGQSLTDLSSGLTFVRLIGASFKKPDIMEREIQHGLYSLAPSASYDISIDSLKNDAGIHETTLHDYGVTIKNMNAAAIDTQVEMQYVPKHPAFGIDFGRNSPKDKSEIVEANQQQMNEAEERLLDEQNIIKATLLFEKVKTEKIAFDVLIEKSAHHILDRKDLIIQSGDNERKFNGLSFTDMQNNFIAHQSPHPRNLPFNLANYYTLANESTHNIHPLRIMASRFIVDNNFLVFYLAYLDDDLKPVWKELTYGILGTEAIRTSSSYSTVATTVLCKLKRFQHCGANMSVGQGTTSDLEIYEKYFYLTL